MAEIIPDTTFRFYERVGAGIKFLDANLNFDWRSRIDRQKLNMGSARSCLLAQIFGSYGLGCQKLGINNKKAAMLGFQLDLCDEDADIDNIHWLNEVNQRLKCEWCEQLS